MIIHKSFSQDKLNQQQLLSVLYKILTSGSDPLPKLNNPDQPSDDKNTD
ncbi:hypothetical protein V6C27_12085 [Peptococcaceae bacterium 1198_IL3148]